MKKKSKNMEMEQGLKEARKVMGDKVKNMSDKQLEVYLIKLQSLVDSWMDEYERQTFEGKTIEEILEEL